MLIVPFVRGVEAGDFGCECVQFVDRRLMSISEGNDGKVMRRSHNAMQ